MNLPFYQDWQFWSAVVAGVALVLSQFPPLTALLRRANIKCEAYNRIHLTHKVGNPNAQWHIIIENSGGKAIRIKEISLFFQKAGDKLFILPAQNYLRAPDSTGNIMLTPFKIKPGEEWSHIINFFPLFSRDEEKEYRALELAIRSDIVSQRELLKNKEILCEANPEKVSKLFEFFEKHFKWEPGEYEFELVITTDNPKVNFSRKYRFTLFESESHELRSYTDGYKHGAGIFWNSAEEAGIIIPVYEQ